MKFSKLPLLVLIFIAKVYCQEGALSGAVFDSRTKETLTGVNIIINELSGVGTATNINGHFFIKLPVGSYSVTASFVGYRSVVKTDIVITAGRETHTVISMQEVSTELSQVIIKADYFDKASMDNSISAIALGPEEIKRSPGAAQDFFRILQGMAGVSFSNDQKNELIVRGGSPNENLVIFDNMEIQSTNHFPSDYNSAGRINMVNLDLIENLRFSTGGFISKYGDKNSSVIDITNREGTRNSSFKGNLNLSMQSFGSVMEGKIHDGKGSWILSLRKSYLDLIKTAIGLSTVPEYWDTQYKVVYDISPVHKISCSGLFGYDKVFDDGSTDEKYPDKADLIDSTGRNKSDIAQWQLAAGINLKSIWSKDFYSQITVYYSNFHAKKHTSEEFVQRAFNNAGEEINTVVINRRPVSIDDHDNGLAAIKTDFIWNVNKTNELNFGAQIITSRYIQDLLLAGDSVRYKKENGWEIIKEEPARQIYNINLFDNYKIGFFANHKLSLFDSRLMFNFGIRYDYFSYSGNYNFSPRLSGVFYFIPSIACINFAYGEYYQTQPFPVYADKENMNVNRYLKNTHSRHLIAGIDYIIDSGLKLSIEGYIKKYDDIPVTENFINYFNHQFRSNRRLNIGQQKTIGLDILLQQKLVSDFYGTIACSVMKSETTDMRIGKEGNTYPSDYDFPLVITAIIGKRLAGLRSLVYQELPWLKYLLYVLPVSDEMELSLRWRYASGKPYTPMFFSSDEQVFEGEKRWSKGSWVLSANPNSERYPKYHRLDISFTSRFNYFDKSLSVYIAIENLYNRKNIAGYEYNSDGTIEREKQFSLVPIAGIVFEF